MRVVTLCAKQERAARESATLAQRRDHDAGAACKERLYEPLVCSPQFKPGMHNERHLRRDCCGSRKGSSVDCNFASRCWNWCHVLSRARVGTCAELVSSC